MKLAAALCMTAILSLSCHSTFAAAQGLSEIFLFKATAETKDGAVYHWEYNSPNDFEYHEKGKAYHGDEAKDKVESIYHHAQVTKQTTDEELAEVFKNNGFSELQRLDVRWQDENGDLYTWLWQEAQTS
ncbi:hypothetical protein [Alteribacillus persepolensis]|uniref:hypothetical protein n=1 Tax=Alteribacillus persepolensis TaxID=568899 RepID=UPI000B846CA5|nr:hypothetical protein [Alteribacillus persepolensis]